MSDTLSNVSDSIWDLSLDKLKNEIDEKNFQTWFSTTKFISYDNNVLVVGVPNSFNKSWLLSNYLDKISTAVREVANKEVEILFNTYYDKQNEEEQSQIREKNAEKQEASQILSRTLNQRYTFSNFVVGETNRFAHAAAKAVSDPTSKSYNPLFIYGGVGLGKTHLMQAIGHQLLKNYPTASILYVTSEQFMNTFIDAITQNKQSEFRNNFRNVDLLLIDDIEFFAGKERTQEEFFHTFNALHSAGKKIVVTSDRPPKEIATLEERLRNRFEWGLTVDIQPPDFETRLAILRKKALLDGIEAPNDVITFIAERIKANIRELEGSLIKVKAYANMVNSPIVLSLAKEVLGSLLVNEQSDKTTVERIQQIICEYFDISPTELTGSVRQKKFANARHIAQYLCRDMTKLSFPEIGRYFGNRDHSSVLHACKKIENDLQSDSNMRNIINYLKRKLTESM